MKLRALQGLVGTCIVSVGVFGWLGLWPAVTCLGGCFVLDTWLDRLRGIS